MVKESCRRRHQRENTLKLQVIRGLSFMMSSGHGISLKVKIRGPIVSFPNSPGICRLHRTQKRPERNHKRRPSYVDAASKRTRLSGVFTQMTQCQNFWRHTSNGLDHFWRFPLGVMFNLTPTRQTFDASFTTSCATLPVWKPQSFNASIKTFIQNPVLGVKSGIPQRQNKLTQGPCENKVTPRHDVVTQRQKKCWRVVVCVKTPEHTGAHGTQGSFGRPATQVPHPTVSSPRSEQRRKTNMARWWFCFQVLVRAGIWIWFTTDKLSSRNDEYNLRRSWCSWRSEHWTKPGYFSQRLEYHKIVSGRYVSMSQNEVSVNCGIYTFHCMGIEKLPMATTVSRPLDYPWASNSVVCWPRHHRHLHPLGTWKCHVWTTQGGPNHQNYLATDETMWDLLRDDWHVGTTPSS